MQRRVLPSLLAIAGVLTVLLPVVAGAAAPAERADLVRIMNDIRSNNWIEAETLAAAQPNRLVAKLVTFYRLLAPETGTPAEIARFAAANPDWPFQSILRARWNAALAAEPDDVAARQDCLTGKPRGARTDARCAEALLTANKAAAARFARRAWIAGVAEPKAAESFQAKYGDLLTTATNWGRFEHLAIAGKVAMAAALVPSLPASRVAVAKAWLALARNSDDAQSLYAALSAKEQATPVVFLAALSAAADPMAEAALWQAHEKQVFAQASGESRALLWRRATYLARILLGSDVTAAASGDGSDATGQSASQGGDAQGGDTASRAKAAYALISQAKPVGELEAVRQDFLAGFIALRMLNEPETARQWFHKLLGGSNAVISRARAYYWLAATETGAQRQADLEKAAAYPDTFYGQQAALALGRTPAQLAAQIRSVPTPRATIRQQIAFAERELPQASVLLVQMGAPRRARPFLVASAETAPDRAGRALAAQLATGLGEIPAAVGIARIAGVDGQMLIRQGWPMPAIATALDPAVDAGFGTPVILSLIRQESSFDTRARSPAGAEGLMQLLPATARMVSRKTGTPLPREGLIGDPEANVALGTAYFGMLMKRFDDCLPLAIAAYNAGPHNVEKWIGAFGDPRKPPGAGGATMLTWIEEIPFNETRNYVERVIEGIVIYRALRGDAADDPISASGTGAALKSGATSG